MCDSFGKMCDSFGKKPLKCVTALVKQNHKYMKWLNDFTSNDISTIYLREERPFPSGGRLPFEMKKTKIQPPGDRKYGLHWILWQIR